MKSWTWFLFSFATRRTQQNSFIPSHTHSASIPSRSQLRSLIRLRRRSVALIPSLQLRPSPSPSALHLAPSQSQLRSLTLRCRHRNRVHWTRLGYCSTERRRVYLIFSLHLLISFFLPCTFWFNFFLFLSLLINCNSFFLVLIECWNDWFCQFFPAPFDSSVRNEWFCRQRNRVQRSRFLSLKNKFIELGFQAWKSSSTLSVSKPGNRVH